MGSKVFKRISARILPVVLFALLISITIGFTGLFSNSKAVRADGDEIAVLTEENTVEFDLTKQGYQRCSFTPDETMYYEFTFDVSGNFWLEKRLFEGDTYLTYTHESSLTYKLQAGKTYILYCESGYSTPGTLTISVAKYYPTTSGECGPSATWVYDLETDSLTISGEKAMYDYADYDGAENPLPPWYFFKEYAKSVTISDGITYIGDFSFYGFHGLETVSIGKDVETISYYAFSNCTALTSFSIPSDTCLTKLGDYALGYCPKLVDFSIPESVTWIGHYALNCCYLLPEVTLPENLEFLGNGALQGCDSLTEVTIPDNITEIGEAMFSGCDKLTKVNFPEDVTSIGAYAFSSCYALETITLPDGITRIENNTFNYCYNLKSIVIPDGVTYIGEYAFYTCSKLSSINIPDGVTFIGNNAFSGCRSLGSVTLPRGITKIEDSTFANCVSFTDFTFPDTITSIGDSAFFSCESLTDPEFPDSLKTIGCDAFSCCDNLTSVSFNDQLESIGQGAFSSCYMLSEVTIPKSVKNIGPRAFASCPNLEEASIGGGYIDDHAFDYCETLKTVTLGENVTYIGNYAFNQCYNLTSISIPGRVTGIGQRAFYECTSLEELTIEEGVTRIGELAFCNCEKLTELTLPASITRIDKAAFNGCSGIENVYCYANPAKLEWTRATNDFIPWSTGGSTPHGLTTCHVFASELDAFLNKFGYGYVGANDYVNVTFVGDLSETIDMNLGDHLYGYSLSLDGDIAVNFYMDLSQAELSDDAYMEFLVPAGAKTVTQKVYVQAKAGEKRTVAQKIDGENPYYMFKCQVSAKDFASPVRAQMIDGERSGETYSYSVKSYAVYIVAHANDNPAYAKAAPLAKALMHYCSWTQLYFGVGSIDWSCVDYDQLFAVTGEEISDAAPAYEEHLEDIPGVVFEGSTLSLKSETTLSLYFTSEEKLSFSCSQGYTIETKKVDNYQVARIRGIAAADLDKLIEITVTCGDKQGTVKFSALNYISNVVNGSSDDYYLICVVKSMYLYYKAAEEYIA